MRPYDWDRQGYEAAFAGEPRRARMPEDWYRGYDSAVREVMRHRRETMFLDRIVTSRFVRVELESRVTRIIHETHTVVRMS